MLALLVQLAIDGIAMGMVYIILSAGLVFIMSVSGIFFITYGQFYMVGAFLTWTAVNLLHLNFFVALLFAIIITTILGMLSYLFIFRYTTYSPQKFLATIAAALGLSLIMGRAGLIIFGTSVRSIPKLFHGMLNIGGVTVTNDKLVLIAITIIVTLALFLFYSKTRTGRAMRAVSFLPEVALLQGINAKQICLISVGIGTALAGFAGGIIAPSYGITPQMGDLVILSVILIAMLGGIDSLLGSVIAGLVIGLTLSYGQYFVGSWVQTLVFSVVGIIILFRPGGLLGKRSLDV